MEQLTPWGVLGLLCQGLGESLGQPLQIFLSAMGVILLYRLFSGFADTGLTDTRPLMNTVAVLCLCGVLLVPCIQFMEQTVDLLSQIGEFVAALTPVVRRTVGRFRTGRHGIKLEHGAHRHGGVDVLSGLHLSDPPHRGVSGADGSRRCRRTASTDWFCQDAEKGGVVGVRPAAHRLCGGADHPQLRFFRSRRGEPAHRKILGGQYASSRWAER